MWASCFPTTSTSTRSWSLNDQKAQYTALGVGTHLAAAYGQPALGGVYKLSAIREPGQEEWTPRLKISEQLYKRTIPGRA